jgi:hypothetical protein
MTCSARPTPKGRYGQSSRNVERDAVDATLSCAHETAGAKRVASGRQTLQDERQFCGRRSRVVQSPRRWQVRLRLQMAR